MSNQEIYNNLENVINNYLDNIDNYSETGFMHKQAPDIWSLGQMYEHLLLTSNYFFLANAVRCLEQRKGQLGGEKSEAGEKVLKHNGLPPIKIKQPGGGDDKYVVQAKEAYKAGFGKILADAQALLTALDADAGEYKTPHPYFGMLNAKEWFWNLEMHFRHHLRQKTELESYLN